MFNLINRKLAESKGGRGMDLLKCRALVRAIELGSFSAAAAEMGYTPSGISHMAAAVEDDVDWSLSDSAVSKIRSSFEKLSEGEEELAYSKAMKTFLKSGVKPKEVSNM